MIDIRAARHKPDAFRRALARKGAAELFDELMEVDARWRDLRSRVEPLRAAKKSQGRPTPEELEELRRAKEERDRLEAELTAAESRRKELLDRVPNPPDASAPDGFTEEDAEVIRVVGRPGRFGGPDHLELAAADGWIDVARAARVSGTRFAYRVGDFALAELALYRFALERLVAKGFVLVLPPVLVRKDAMYGTGFLPTDEVNIYRVERDDLYLTGTSEVGLAAFHMEEELDLERLPLRYCGFSTNFRREAGAAGKDTRGMFRVHQFDKVEMFVFCAPEGSSDEHEYLLSVEEELVQELGIPYRVVNVAAGDLGASAAKKYDIEAWFPSQERWREITSTSNTTDYQARRLKIHVRDDERRDLVHTLNGTAVTARALLAVMENFQDDAGSIAIPEALWQFGAPKRLGRVPASV